jgi:aspartyl-tRNA(Asn)/glutamyl-tRNA(Gln) amidotransferase subunit A
VRDQDLQDLTVSGTAKLIKKKELSASELINLFLERIHRLNPGLNAYITVTTDDALREADKADKEILSGKYRGPLHGIPFSIKDNLPTKGVRTTAGSKILSDWIPDSDATVVGKIRDAGAPILGKTNMDEWALGGTTINPFYGTTRNPWDTNRTAGGSSGGSAAAVAASLCLGSIGTDSAQSVRNPASICGIVGLKPTYGRISRFGGIAGTGGFSTDHFGILSKTVEDCALVLEVLAGHDPKDPSSAHEPVPRYTENLNKTVKGTKIGLLRDYFDEFMIGEVKDKFYDAIKALESLGMKTRELSIPHMKFIHAIRNCTSRAENAAAHDKYLRTRPRDYSPRVLYTYLCALTIPAATYVNAQRARRIISDEFSRAFKDVDIIVAPTVSHPTPTIDECNQGSMNLEGKKIELQDSRGSLNSFCTSPFNLMGLPALNVCCGFSKLGMPIGFQIVAAPFQESRVLNVGHAYERTAKWYEKKPPLD